MATPLCPNRPALIAAIAIGALLAAAPASAAPPFFTTGNPDGLMAAASRPDSATAFEIETGDDFALTANTVVTGASFTGLIPDTSAIKGVTVEIYRVFPLDSDTVRSPQVKTRVNSPSDVAFDSRDGSGLSFATEILSPSFTASNSVQPGGIHPLPGQMTGGNGPITGEEVQFDISFTTPFVLPADHYFFVPQVQLDDGTFYWLSAPRPIVPPGTQFPPGVTDLQGWTRDANLDPDWSRIGTDIVGGTGTFNFAFSLESSVPEPAEWSVLLIGFFGLGLALRARAETSPQG